MAGGRGYSRAGQGVLSGRRGTAFDVRIVTLIHVESRDVNENWAQQT